MSWAKIDDLLPHHNKLVEAGNEAPAIFGWYVASICYAQRQRTDGWISPKALGLLLPGANRPPARIITRLVELRLWDQDGVGWRVHDFLEHNASAADRRLQARQASRVRWDARSNAPSNADRIPPSNAPSIPHRNARSNADRNAVADATPLRSSPKPKPLPSEGDVDNSDASRRLTDQPEGLSATRLGRTTPETATAYPVTEAEYLASLSRLLPPSRS